MGLDVGRKSIAEWAGRTRDKRLGLRPGLQLS